VAEVREPGREKKTQAKRVIHDGLKKRSKRVVDAIHGRVETSRSNRKEKGRAEIVIQTLGQLVHSAWRWMASKGRKSGKKKRGESIKEL